QDAFGDVRVRDIGPGGAGGANNDSIWMDLGFPVMTAPNGKRYKPLFAAHVVDLSNRLHMWAHGNNIGSASAFNHVSNMGIGPPEVNLGRGISANAAELQWLFNTKYGGPAPGALPAGRFAPTNVFPWFGKIDANGLDLSGKSTMPLSTSFLTVGGAVA